AAGVSGSDVVDVLADKVAVALHALLHEERREASDPDPLLAVHVERLDERNTDNAIAVPRVVGEADVLAPVGVGVEPSIQALSERPRVDSGLRTHELVARVDAAAVAVLRVAADRGTSSTQGLTHAFVARREVEQLVIPLQAGA